MRKKIISLILIIFCILSFIPLAKEKAYADPFTSSQIASLSYAMMANWGIRFSAGSATAAAMNDFMSNNVQNYAESRGGSVADAFVGSIAVDAVGKLVVSNQMYNSVVNFYDWLKQRYDISDVLQEITAGTYNGAAMGDYVVDQEAGGEVPASGVGMSYDNWVTKRYTVTTSGFDYGRLYNGGVVIATNPGKDTERLYTGNYSLHYDNQIVYILIGVIRWTLASPVEYFHRVNVATAVSALDNSLGWYTGSDYEEPVILNPDKEWTGTVGGYSVPDTNLDQLLGNINQAVADNNLVVDGEVIDVQPVPVPTWQPVDDVIDGINQGGEVITDIGSDIGDISGHLDDLGDKVDGITDALTGDIVDHLESIREGVGVISLDVPDITDAITSQTGIIESIEEALEGEDVNWRKFDLRGLFPFCIPFDIYNMLEALDSSPTAPHVQIPFVIPSIGFSYTLDLDFSAFDQVASVMRQMELIVYALGLAWATSKVIKW